MAIFDINGRKIIDSGNGSGTTSNVEFFDVVYPNYTNLYDGEYYIGGIDGSGGVNTSQTSCFVSDYINILGGTYLYAGNRSNYTINIEEKADVAFGCVHLAFYDANKKFINLSTRPTAPIAIPNNAKYCRVSWQPYSMSGVDTSVYFVGVVEDTTTPIVFEKYYNSGEIKSAYVKEKNLTYTDNPPYKGKTWVLFGDSLTDSYGGHDWQKSTAPDSVGGWTDYYWASKIGRELGLKIDNRGKSGSNINIGNNGIYADVCGINMLNAFLSEIEDGTIEAPDYITIGFGTNTIGGQVGTIDDTSETTNSVYGATKYFIEKIREKCPMTTFGFVLPPVGSWEGSSTVKDINKGREAIKTVLETEGYKVPFIDMSVESGITVDMLPDGIHVSSHQANNLYYHAMRRFMIGL